jgi:hypothetical protein
LFCRMPRAGANHPLDVTTCGPWAFRLGVSLVYKRRAVASFVRCFLGLQAARPWFVLFLVRRIWLHDYGWFRLSFGVSQVDKRCLVLPFVVSKYAS